MKFKLALSTATALGLLMGSAMAGDKNVTKTEQTGLNNDILVIQDGSGNYAGEHNTAFGQQDAVLRQTGNNNSIDIQQSGSGNRVGDHYGTLKGAHQTGNRNVLVVTQKSSAEDSASHNGNVIWGVRQSVTAGSATSNSGTTTTNEATVTQEGPGGTGLRVTHFVGQIHQTLDGLGQKNEITIHQTGNLGGYAGTQVYSSASNHGNRLFYASQNGTGNVIDVKQKGVGPAGSHGAYGPRNAIHTIQQVGQNHTATVLQDGYRNYVQKVDQSGFGSASFTGNTTFISLTGEGNGASGSIGVNSTAAVGAFKSGRGAEAAGAFASTVTQSGTGNEVHYTVLNANFNQFGFWQDGVGNKAVDILITGDRNELGVWQDGTNNRLELATIAGEDNIIGLIQHGIDNVATIDISGHRNGGYNDFTSGSASDIASDKGLTPGLLEQYGTFNQVTLTVNGSDNVFAFKQDNSLHAAPTQNRIVAVQTGTFNEAAVVQQGNNNYANVNQNGGSNSVGIIQGGGATFGL